MFTRSTRDEDNSPKAKAGLTKEGFDFLGCSVDPGIIQPSRDAREALRRVAEGGLAEDMRFAQTLNEVHKAVKGWGQSYWFCNAIRTMADLDSKIDDGSDPRGEEAKRAILVARASDMVTNSAGQAGGPMPENAADSAFTDPCRLRGGPPRVPGGRSHCPMIRRCGMLMLLLMAAACAHAREPSAPVAEGRRVFQDQGCYICHTIGKTGWRFGPDLSHIGATHDRSYWIGWLRDPSSQKPTTHMPKLTLTDSEVQALADYLGSLQ